MAVDPLSGGTVSPIAGAIRQAAQTTGISFEYLLTTARIESNLDPAAKASTSSARGLYQFIDQTWLATLKQDGPALGLGRYANAISRTPDGQYTVSDPAARSAILRLRDDPAASALLAGALARDNAAQLAPGIGRAPTEGELYIAHFLGAEGAARLITAAANEPSANAAAMFPKAAAANAAIFYDRGGRPRSAGEVYARLTGRFETARAVTFAPGPRRAPDTAGVTAAYAGANGLPPPPDPRPLFQAMFSDPARGAVSPAVATLWAQPAAPTEGAASGRGLDLFSDGGKPEIGKLFGNG